MSEPVSIRILDREYLIACTPEERPGLLNAALYVDTKMRELRAKSSASGMDRVAVLAALNIAHELLGLRQKGSSQDDDLNQHLLRLQAKLDGAVPGSLQ